MQLLLQLLLPLLLFLLLLQLLLELLLLSGHILYHLLMLLENVPREPGT